MSAPVWKLSVDVESNTAKFTSGLSDAAGTARDFFARMKSGSAEAGEHISTNMFASRHAIMAMSEAFGVTAPRAITAFLAHIGPVGAALEAAFPFTAIVLGAVLLIEHLEKVKEEGQKLTDDQVKFGTEVQRAFNTLEQKLTQAGIKADELRGDHLGALQLKLKEIDQQSMSDLASEFDKVSKAADDVLLKMKSHWYEVGIGSDGARNALTNYHAEFDLLMAKGDKAGAVALWKGTREEAEKTLNAMREMRAANAETDRMGLAVGVLPEHIAAANQLKKVGVQYTDNELRSQELLLGVMDAQGRMLSANDKLTDVRKSNTRLEEHKKGSSGTNYAAEGAKQAAEHAQKMGELTLSIEKEQKQASLNMHEASIAERLASDTDFANRKYAIETQGNEALIAALDRHGKDYVNKLRELQMKAEEMTAQHALDLATLNAKASEATYRQQISDMEQGEREMIEKTDSASSERLAAIDAAMKEEAEKGLQNTAHYRELGNQRIAVERAIKTEMDKLAADAGKESAENALKLGEIQLSADKQAAALRDSARRQTIAQRIAEEVDFANRDYQLKQQALQNEIAALDTGAKDYENKLQAMHNRERQMAQAHEIEITGIKQKAEIDRNTKILGAQAQFNQAFMSGLTQVLMGHESFAHMMTGFGNQVVSGALENSLKMAAGLDRERLPQAASAARTAFLSGMHLPPPANFVIAPVMGAAAFSAMMAFEQGGVVPGIGRGDVVPAMLTPGEGIVPNSMMGRLDEMTKDGGGGDTYHANVNPTYHIQVLDASGVKQVLTKHNDVLRDHVEGTLRRMNR